MRPENRKTRFVPNGTKRMLCLRSLRVGRRDDGRSLRFGSRRSRSGLQHGCFVDSGEARLEGVGEFGTIEILADENERVLARLAVPFAIELGVEEHVHPLENEPLG